MVVNSHNEKLDQKSLKTRTGVICRVVTPKDKERNPSPLTKFYEEKKFNVIRRSKYKMKYYLLCFH